MINVDNSSDMMSCSSSHDPSDDDDDDVEVKRLGRQLDGWYHELKNNVLVSLYVWHHVIQVIQMVVVDC